MSADARNRVREVIATTGFAPNAAARSLASRRTGVVGVVIPSGVHNLFEDPYFGRLLVGMSRTANAVDVSLSLFLFQTAEDDERLYSRIVTAGLVDGVVVTATRMGDPLLERLSTGDLPIVVVGNPDRAGISSVDADNVGGARMAVDHLAALGHRRVGCLGGPLDTTAARDRLEGFRAGMTANGLDLRPELLTEGDFTEQGGHDAMLRLLEHRPDAVFVASDTMASGALRALRSAGVRVPDDMALVSFDGLPASELADPPVTTVRQPIPETGERAIQLLLDLVDGELEEPRTEILPTELVIRESCGATAGREARTSDPSLADRSAPSETDERK